MSKTLIFGHKNPDTDTICSAIALAYLKEQMGEDVEAVRLGDISDETQFVLDYFSVSAPRLVGDVSGEAEDVILVDHNERSQSADGIENVRVRGVVDHHRIANFETNDPLYYRAEPVGCTATILVKLFSEHAVVIPKDVAGLLLGAVISDTLLFKSPTTTEEDKAAGKVLAEAAGVDVEEFGLAQLKAGASIAGKQPKALINIDSKPFVIGTVTIEVAQINVVDFSDILAIKSDLLAEMERARVEKQQALFFVIVTDILNNNSIGLVSGNESFVTDAFGIPVREHIVELPGVVSRKKQVIPQLTEVIEKQAKK